VSVFHGRDDRAPLFRAAARFENLGSSDSAVIDSRYKAAQDRIAGFSQRLVRLGKSYSLNQQFIDQHLGAEASAW